MSYKYPLLSLIVLLYMVVIRAPSPKIQCPSEASHLKKICWFQRRAIRRIRGLGREAEGPESILFSEKNGINNNPTPTHPPQCNLFCIAQNTGWRWNDGSLSRYTRWSSGEPNNNSKNDCSSSSMEGPSERDTACVCKFTDQGATC
uniref:C-type lectin domain-containing protein n=1 Tax=Laticauda laticaudata TaxID=8630 RepID=A0A8C5SNJ3_LATLA